MELDEFDDEELDEAELLLLLLLSLLWDFPVNLSKREDILPGIEREREKLRVE